jgi:DNA-3-methyladenine glycosylase II
MPRQLTNATLEQATHALAARDRDLGRLVATHGVPPMWGRPTGFATLVWIILEQQVSIAAARTLFRRLGVHLGGRVTPEAVLAAGVEGLRAFGLTRQKSRYCHELAVRVSGRALDLQSVSRLPEAEARAALLDVPGIGNWSVDVYFVMALRRPDVWPRGDLALGLALHRVKRLRAVPTHERQEAIAAQWAPWRSVAARILWADYLAARA